MDTPASLFEKLKVPRRSCTLAKNIASHTRRSRSLNAGRGAVLLAGGAQRHRVRGAHHEDGQEHQGHRLQARSASRLQVQLRQGKPDVFQIVPRPRPRRRPGGSSYADNDAILEKVKVAYDLPIVTDVHETIQCEAVGRVADIIQIPAFLCRQTDLLVAAARTGRIINIKKGQFCAPSVMVNSAEKVRLAGNPNVMVCERGTMFGYNDLVVDPRNLEWMREAHCPVVADITHSLQQPAGRKLEGGGVASGGLRELIPCVARMSVAVGVDGIFMEVHDDPLNAPVDGPTQWPLRHLEAFLEELIAIAKVSKGKQPFEIDLTPYDD